MTEYHNTHVAFTAGGCRARCLARGCNWMGRNHMAIPNMVIAWHQARAEGRRHTTDQNRNQR